MALHRYVYLDDSIESEIGKGTNNLKDLLVNLERQLSPYCANCLTDRRRTPRAVLAARLQEMKFRRRISWSPETGWTVVDKGLAKQGEIL